jgi:hypothetical protein
MLQDKKADTDAEKQKALLRRFVEELGRAHPDFYYQSSAMVARQIQRHIAQPGALNEDERRLMGKLGQRDIEILLSLH